jgi:hypothetical protein
MFLMISVLFYVVVSTILVVVVWRSIRLGMTMLHSLLLLAVGIVVLAGAGYAIRNGVVMHYDKLFPTLQSSGKETLHTIKDWVAAAGDFAALLGTTENHP